MYSNDANCNVKTAVLFLILFQLFKQRKSGVVVNFTDHDSRTKCCMYFSSSSQLSQVLSISYSPSESILPFLQVLQFSRLIHSVDMAQNRIWKIAQNKCLDAKKYFNKHFKSVFAQNKVPITSPRKMFTYQSETAEGEGIINGSSDDDREGAWGRIKFTSLILKFADWFYFFKHAPSNPLVRYAYHISALQHRRVYLSRGGRRGKTTKWRFCRKPLQVLLPL